MVLIGLLSTPKVSLFTLQQNHVYILLTNDVDLRVRWQKSYNVGELLSRLFKKGITTNILNEGISYPVIYYKVNGVVNECRQGSMSANLLVPYFGTWAAMKLASKTLSGTHFGMVVQKISFLNKFQKLML